MLRQLENLTGYSGLDEFAVDASGALAILQVRPMTVDFACTPEHERALYEELELCAPRWAACGIRPRTSLGVRRSGPSCRTEPGGNDRPEARSSGREPVRLLITDDVWASQRAQFGYRDVRPQSLMRLCGTALYRHAGKHELFIPRDLDEDIARRIVEAGLERLQEEPELHDKLEFFLVPTCLDCHLTRGAITLWGGQVFPSRTSATVRDAYGRITASAPEHCRNAQRQLVILEERREAVLAGALPLRTKPLFCLKTASATARCPLPTLPGAGLLPPACCV